MNHPQLRGVCGLVATACAFSAAPALAGDRGPIDQDIQMSLGGFFMDSDTDVRLDGTTGIGTEIDWGTEFDYDDVDRFRVDAFWRFAAHHKVRLMYFENKRSRTATLTRDIEFGDTTFPVNLQVDTSLDTQILELAYEYAFLRRENLELAGSLGIHNVQMKARMRGDIAGPGGGGTVEADEVADGNGPLPVFGLRCLWNIGGNFYFDGLAQFFALEYDNYDGSLEDYKVGVTWFPLRNVGIGVAYNRFVTRLDVEDSDFSGTLRYQYAGPMAFITVGF